jgi:hypothetical protein
VNEKEEGGLRKAVGGGKERERERAVADDDDE